MFRYWLERWTHEDVIGRWDREQIPSCCVVAYAAHDSVWRPLPQRGVHTVATHEPCFVEKKLVASVCLPLKLDQNRKHPFHSILSALRRGAKRQADELPVWSVGKMQE